MSCHSWCRFARYFGADANSCAFQAAAIVTEFVGSVALAAATGGSSALARSGVMGARLAMGARSAMLAADVVQAARGVVKYQESGDVTDLAGAAALVGGHAVGRLVGRGSQTGRAAELIEEGCTSRTCFVAGTQVLALSTGSGQATDETGSTTATNIEDIEVGDWVWSRNEETGEEGIKPVTRLFRNEADTLVHLTYTSGAGASAAHTGTHTLTGTEEHPFWSVTRSAWVPMGELQAGETLLLGGPALSPSKGGQTATATSVRIEHLATPVTVYNFEVADWHTYHVGTADAGWVYVHNLCARDAVDKLKALRLEARTKGTELNKLISAQRKTAVEQAWAAERAMVMRQGYGTRKWTPNQMQELVSTGRVRRYQGHHINSVKSHTYMAGMPFNIRFVTRWQHFKEHLFNWRNPTSGPLVNRGGP